MFRRSRIRIVAAVMGSALLFLLTTLGAVYLSSDLAIRRQNEEMLSRYASQFTADGQRGAEGTPPELLPDGEDAPRPPLGRGEGQRRRDENAFRVSAFYSVLLSPAGEALRVDNGGDEWRSGESLIETARQIVDDGRAAGRTGTLLYRVQTLPEGTLIVFLDDAVSENSTHTMLRQMLLAGGAAAVLLFFLSVFLARRIVAPLEENDRRQKQFVSDAGHELKTPVSVISANLDLLARQGKENEWISNIRYENERMGALVANLLDLSRAESAPAPKETLDLSRLVTGEALPLESVAFERGRVIRQQIEPDVTVEGNRTQLRQLVSILLDNAIRHAEGGEEILLTLRRERHTAILAVENDGPEIPAEARAHLFERFYRLDDARTGGEGHYGLGLAIARAITDAHRGTIGVECRGGRVLFTVTLPAQK